MHCHLRTTVPPISIISVYAPQYIKQIKICLSICVNVVLMPKFKFTFILATKFEDEQSAHSHETVFLAQEAELLAYDRSELVCLFICFRF